MYGSSGKRPTHISGKSSITDFNNQVTRAQDSFEGSLCFLSYRTLCDETEILIFSGQGTGQFLALEGVEDIYKYLIKLSWPLSYFPENFDAPFNIVEKPGPI